MLVSDKSSRPVSRQPLGCFSTCIKENKVAEKLSKEFIPHGSVTPKFEKVKAEFKKNFIERGELGAACAVYYKSQKVVDLWGGIRDEKSGDDWKEDTLVHVFSTTKGVAALTVAVAQSRGLFEYEDKISTYWPEFAQNGKEDITIRELTGC
jgi:CubicO group peptidase (beta-lactamase class C family)